MIFTSANIDSSLIKDLYWNDETEQLSVVFRNYKVPYLIYCGVSRKEFNQLISAESIGKYYLSNIKNKKQMTEEKRKPKGINESSDKFRWFDISINVDKINKDHIFAGEKGNWLGLKVRLMPDGTVDQNENCGFVVQKLPKEVEGGVLGNIRENKWESGNNESFDDVKAGGQVAPVDDLPF